MLHKTNKCTCSQDHVDKGMAYINGGYLEDEVVPTSDGLAIAMDVSRMTPYNWKEMDSNQFKNEIAYIMDRVQALQGKMIVSGGLSGQFHPAFAGKLVGNHGFNQSSTIDLKSSDGSMSPKEITVTDPIEAAKQYLDIMGGDE